MKTHGTGEERSYEAKRNEEEACGACGGSFRNTRGSPKEKPGKQKRREEMAFKLVFHVGQSVVNDDDMLLVWDMFRSIEEAKYGLLRPKEVQLATAIYRDKESYELVRKLVRVSLFRERDPAYQDENMFIPQGVDVVHVYVSYGFPVPWSECWPSRSPHRLWTRREKRIFGRVQYDVQGVVPLQLDRKKRRWFTNEEVEKRAKRSEEKAQSIDQEKS